jgi:hypothetical protein
MQWRLAKRLQPRMRIEELGALKPGVERCARAYVIMGVLF